MTTENEYIKRIKEIEQDLDVVRWAILKLHDLMMENQINKKSEE